MENQDDTQRVYVDTFMSDEEDENEESYDINIQEILEEAKQSFNIEEAMNSFIIK